MESLSQTSAGVRANDCAQSSLSHSIEYSGSSHAHEPQQSAQTEPNNAAMTRPHSEKPTKSRKRPNDISMEGKKKRARTEKENGMQQKCMDIKYNYRLL